MASLRVPSSQVWDADEKKHVQSGSKIQVYCMVLLSQRVTSEGNYLVDQLEYLAGTTNEYFESTRSSLGPLCDRVRFSMQPNIPGIGPAIAEGYQQRPSGPETTQSASMGQSSGVAVPITFQGVGITPSYQRQAGSSIGVKLAGSYSFEKLTHTTLSVGREPSQCELELRLTSYGGLGGQYDPALSLSKHMLRLPDSYGCGIAIRPEGVLPTVKWWLPQAIKKDESVSIDFILDGSFSGVYRRHWRHLFNAYKSYHFDLATARKPVIVNMQVYTSTLGCTLSFCLVMGGTVCYIVLGVRHRKW